MIIAPEGMAWTDLSSLANEVAIWERAAGRQLPDGYRRFMMSFNGGRICPSLFTMKLPAAVWDLDSTDTFCDPLYDWDYVAALWLGTVYEDSTPPDMCFIGCSPGGIQVLMSLRKHDHGAIYIWLGSNQPWGSDGNNDAALHPQATSFEDFLTQMFDNDDGDAQRYWDSPRHRLLAKPLRY